jgi:glucose-6-phosphate isomerase
MEKNHKNLKDYDSIKELFTLKEKLSEVHLRELLSDKQRNSAFSVYGDKFLFNFSHEKLDINTFEKLLDLSKEAEIPEKFKKMFTGEKINSTENRRVLHTALRKEKNDSLVIDDNNDIIKDVHEVLDRVKTFSENVRTGKHAGFTNKKLKNFVSIGIGGSYLGPEFIFNSIKNNYDNENNNDYKLLFLANVCPIDFYNSVAQLDAEETLFIIVSKTFTTAETILNARNCRNWLIEQYKKKEGYEGLNKNDENYKKIIASHFCAVSTNIPATNKFGIESDNVFGFWDWVGGRYSVWSAVGAVPLSLYFGFEVFEEFLAGGRAIDETISKWKPDDDKMPPVPVILGLLGFYNTFIWNKTTRAILPYSQALNKFPSHVQQLDMESNGKSVSITTNEFLDYETSPIVFGEPGTNGQHSFYQLIHQGRNVSCEFITHAKPQKDLKYEGEIVSNHEELLSNFFAQPDALALGKTKSELIKSNTPENLINHKTFLGDRTSSSLLFNELNAYTTGELLAIYEHRVATEGFLYDVNSFDQWGVELGKVLANETRKVFADESLQSDEVLDSKFNSSTSELIKYFIKNKK